MARVKKTEKKKWFLIVAPKLFHNQVVGEILLSNPSDAVGRIVPVNLANLARDPRRQHIIIKLKTNNVAGEKIHTEPIGYEISPSFIKRMVRKRGAKIDHTFSVRTADDQKLKLKIIILTRRNTNLSVKTALRKKTEEILGKEFKKINFIELMQLIVSHKIQGSMKKQLSKVTPLKSFEIRHLSIEKVKKYEAKPVEGKKEEGKPSEPQKLEIKKISEKPKEEAPKEEETKKEEVKEEKKEAPKEKVEEKEEAPKEEETKKEEVKEEKKPEEKKE
jgi:ribosomal protein S3AE